MGVSRKRYALAGERTPGTHCTGDWVAPEPVWTQRPKKETFASDGDRTSVARPTARHYTDLATRPTSQETNLLNPGCGLRSLDTSLQVCVVVHI
jgi:hypothetical protein